MARIHVSAARFSSMLANRHKTAAQVATEVPTAVSLLALETTDTEVEFADLQALAKYFKKPWSYLLQDEAEVFPNLGQDNRTYANQQVPVSSNLISEFEAARTMLNAAIELFPQDHYEVPPTVIMPSMPASVAAGHIRAFLDVSIEEQLGTNDEYAALRLWIDALQRRGLYVSQRRLRDRTIRAFSTTLDDQALIVADTGDTPYARIFSVLHEYCHVVLRSTGICDLEQHSTIEQYCNDVAAEALMPAGLLQREMTGVQLGGDADADDELRRLSHRLRVSQAALLIRLHQTGVLADEAYEAMEHRRQARRPKAKSKSGQFYATAINRVGRRFARNVFGALADGAINRADAGALLGVGEHLVNRFRSELDAGGDSEAL